MDLLNRNEMEQALKFVSDLISSKLANGPQVEDLAGGGFDLKCGAFVTLHKAGHLRGCMGRIESIDSLGSVLRVVTLDSAFGDPRFMALKPDEWSQCKIEISVLSEPQRVDSYHEIETGRHGVILDFYGQQAVFLPQVATEQGWTRETMLTQLALKAGLHADDWQQAECKFDVFEAQIIRKDEH
jgi:AmmeMemoRadiSam system protein A